MIGHSQGYPQSQNRQYNNMMQNQMPVTPEAKLSASLTWVQGLLGARVYPVPVDRAIMLWDAEGPYFYKKGYDETGKPYLKMYEFKEIEDGQTTQDAIGSENFIGKEDFDSFIKGYNETMQQMSEELTNLRHQFEEDIRQRSGVKNQRQNHQDNYKSQRKPNKQYKNNKRYEEE